eukprot:2843660-Amphidinium_carterae.1
MLRDQTCHLQLLCEGDQFTINGWVKEPRKNSWTLESSKAVHVDHTAARARFGVTRDAVCRIPSVAAQSETQCVDFSMLSSMGSFSKTIASGIQPGIEADGLSTWMQLVETAVMIGPSAVKDVRLDLQEENEQKLNFCSIPHELTREVCLDNTEEFKRSDTQNGQSAQSSKVCAVGSSSFSEEVATQGTLQSSSAALTGVGVVTTSRARVLVAAADEWEEVVPIAAGIGCRPFFGCKQ